MENFTQLIIIKQLQKQHHEKVIGNKFKKYYSLVSKACIRYRSISTWCSKTIRLVWRLWFRWNNGFSNRYGRFTVCGCIAGYSARIFWCIISYFRLCHKVSSHRCNSQLRRCSRNITLQQWFLYELISTAKQRRRT